MKIDLKVVFLILAIFCQFYVDGWWGSSRRYGGGRSSSRRFTSIRTPSRRSRLWSSGRTPSLRRPSYRTPRVRRPSVRRRSWWGRRRTVRKPRVRRPSVRRRSWWGRRRTVRKPRVRRPSVRRRSWWGRRRTVRKPRVRRPSVRRRSWWGRRRTVRKPRVRRPSVRRRSSWGRRRTVRKPRVRRPSVRRRRWWSRRRTVRKPKPRVRRPSVRRRSWWGRRRTVRKPISRVRKPSARCKRWWGRKRDVCKPSARKPTDRRTKTKTTKQEPGVKKLLNAPLKVSKGQITFDAEGNDIKGSRYFSRKAHVPSTSSGITLGRGYDLKEKTESQVYKDLIKSGIPKATAETFSKGVGLSGQAAKDYIKDNNLQSVTITHKQQKKLFTKTYNSIAADAKRIAEKSDVVKTYGKTNWDGLNNAIRDVVVDLRYRGDYTPETRKKIQSAIAENNLKKFTELMSDRDYWVKTRGVPKDRFERRKKALEEAAKKG